jgi:hypothetical protein
MTVAAGHDSMTWLLPWRRHADREAHDEVQRADERLKESRTLRTRAANVSKSMSSHKRRNRFGEMLDSEIFGDTTRDD